MWSTRFMFNALVCLSRFTFAFTFYFILFTFILTFSSLLEGTSRREEGAGEGGVVRVCVCVCVVLKMEWSKEFISSSDIKTHHHHPTPQTPTKCSAFRSNDIFSHLPLHTLPTAPFFTNLPPGPPAACMYACMYACMHEIVGTCIALLCFLCYTYVKDTSDSL